MNRSALIVIVLLFLFSGSASAQTWKMKRYEAMLGMGGTFYMGDIGSITPKKSLAGLKDVAFRFTRPVIFAGFRYKVYERIWVKMNLNFGWLYGDDTYGSNDSRGIVFRTSFFEPSLQAEYAFIADKSSNNYLMMKGKGIVSFASNISFYGFAGFGPVIFSPKILADPYNRTTADHPKVAMAFPVGLGVKYGLTPDWMIGFELGGRWTTTDYLDAFTSQYSKSNDFYYLATFQMIYKLDTSRDGWPTIKRR